MHDYKDLRATARQIVEEAQSFRGGSPFVSMMECIDDQRIGEGGGHQAYDLMSWPPTPIWTWLEPEEFARIAARTARSLSPADVEGMAGWFRLRGLVPMAQECDGHAQPSRWRPGARMSSARCR